MKVFSQSVAFSTERLKIQAAHARVACALRARFERGELPRMNDESKEDDDLLYVYVRRRNIFFK